MSWNNGYQIWLHIEIIRGAIKNTSAWVPTPIEAYLIGLEAA